MDELEILIQADLDQNKSVTAINKSIKKIEKKIEKLKLQVTVDNEKSKSAIAKEIERLNKQKRKLFVDLQLRKDTLKKQYKELQKESNLSLNINTEIAQRQIKNVSNVMGDTKNETIGLGLTLKNAFSNAGLIMTSQRAINVVRRAINEVTQAIKEYDEYTKNLKIITNKDNVSDLIADYATKSIDMKIDISEYEAASEVILRAGKYLAESAEYTESAIKLAKTGFIETDTAAENLIVIANSYDLTADKLKNVTDALLTLDVQSNTEAGALSSAMAKSAKNAQLAGLSYEQLGATIAKLRDTTGKSEAEISTALNNIFNRTYRVKPNAFTFENENGEMEDLTKPLSDVEKIVNQLGISIRKSATEFKDFEEIISTIAPIWKDLDSVSQNAVSSVFAGQHKNVFLNLVNDWQEIVELTKTAENSINATEQKYEAYLDSIQAKSAEFSTVSKEMWNHLVPDGLVGDLTEAGTATLKFVDDYKVLQTALKSAAFYAFAKGAITAKNSLVGMVTDLKNVSTAFSQLEAVQKSSLGTAEYANNINALGKTVGTLTDKQAKLVLSTKSLSNSQRIAILNAAGLEDAEAEQRLATLGLAQANQTATTSTLSLSGSMRALWSIFEANPILVLTAAFTAFTAIQHKVQRENEKMRESAVESIKQYDEQAKSLEDLRQKYIDIVDSEDSTAKKTEELNKWKQTLIETYGLEKEAIEQVNLAREDGLKLIDDEIIKNKMNGAETWLTENKKAYEDAKRKLLGANNSTETTVIPRANIVMNIDKSALDDYSENFDDIMKQLTIKNPTKDNPLAQIKIQGSNVLQQYENLSKILNDITSIEVTKGLNKSEKELYDALLKKQSEYKKVVTDDMREIVENGKKYTSMIQLYNFETDSGISFENVSDSTYKEFRDKFLESLGYGYKKDSEDFSLDIEKILLDMLPDLENAYRGIEITDIIDTTNTDEIVNDISTVENAVEDLEKSLEKLSKSASSYVSNQKTISNAFKEIEEHGQLSASTIQSLTEAGYAQALSVDSTTNAVTLNKSAVEKLNEQYREKIKLDGIQQKSELEEKFKEEQKAITDLSTEMRYANAERRTAIALEMQQHGLVMSDIAEQIAQIDALANSVYAPTFESGSSSSSKSEKPQSVLDYEKWVAEQEHKIAMGQLKEDETYYDEKLRRAEIAYSGLADYESDLWKVQEEVYKGKEKLAQEAFDKEHDLFEKRVDNLEDYADKLSETSVTSDGTNLTTQEKFREVAAVYKEIQSEIEREINRIVQAGVEGNEKLLEELEKQWDKYADKISDTFKSAVEAEKSLLENQKSALSDVYDKEIDKIKKQQDDAKKSADAEIDLVQEKIDNLKKVNDEKQQEYDIEKAKQDLEKSGQRTRMVYGSDGTISYKQDTDAIAEAQQNLDKLLLEKQVNTLETQKSLLEDMRDKESESYDKLIEDIESQKEQDERQFDILIQRLEDYLNPNSDTSNSDVWSEIAKMDGASYRNGKWVDKDGTEIDINALLSKVDEVVDSNKSENNAKIGNNAIINTDKINQTLDKANEVIENLKEDKAENVIKSDDAITKMLHTLGVKIPDGKRADDVLKNLTLNINPYNQAQSIVDEMNNNFRKITQSVNVKPSVSVGELSLNIQTPVGTIEDIAKHAATGVLERAERQALMEIPNVFMKGIYNRLPRKLNFGFKINDTADQI